MGWTGWSVSARRHLPPFTCLMWCKPKVACIASLYFSTLLPAGGPRWPERPFPQAGVVPAGPAEPMDGWMVGWKDGWKEGWVAKGKSTEEGVTKTRKTLSSALNLPCHPPTHLTLPTYPPPHTDTLFHPYAFILYVCAHIVISVWASLVNACIRAKMKQCICVSSLCVWNILSV